ncbi:MAG: hypothetical protein ACTSWY_11790 [Promethearchaeota archaeon]
MNKLGKGKIVVDTSIVPPSGIEGIINNMNGKEIYPGIYAIGAIIIGKLKTSIENKMLRDAKAVKKDILIFIML